MDILQGVNYLYTSNSQQGGPVEGTQLVQLAQEGHILSTDHIWTEGMAEWLPATSVNQLAPLYQAQAQAQQPQVQAPQGYVQPQPDPTPSAAGTPGAPVLKRRGKTRPPGARSSLPGATTGRQMPGATGQTMPGQTGVLQQRPGGMVMGARKGAKPAMMIWLFFIGLLSLPSASMLPTLFIPSGGGQPSDSALAGIVIASIAWSAAGMICLLIYSIFQLVYLHRAWSYIQDIPGIARTTPGSAVGMLFIPFFNYYWIFNVFPGWVTDFNKYLDARQASLTPRASQGLYIAGLLIPLVHPFMMADMCKKINSLATPTDPALQDQ